MGCTEGQVWSLVLGFLAAVALIGGGLPDVVWRPDPPSAAAAFSPPGPEVAAPAGPTAGIAPPIVPSAETIERVSLPPPSVPTASAGRTATGGPLGEAAAESDPPVDAPVPDRPPATPLRVVDGGYASSMAGTPFASSGVPPGGLAIAVRAGQVDKVSFVVLDGNADVLELAVDPTPGANVLEPFAGLLLCPVLEAGWHVGDGDTSLADAPAYDCEAAMRGARADSGDSWTFDLGTVDGSLVAGFAIVPETTTSRTFQVVLLRTAPEEEP